MIGKIRLALLIAFPASMVAVHEPIFFPAKVMQAGSERVMRNLQASSTRSRSPAASLM
jgi:hypothetical protein